MDQALSVMTQFGAAGLIGVLWVLERRHAAQRDRQLDQAHERILSRERELDALLAVITDATRAIIALEQTQRRLVELLNRLRDRATAADAA